MTHAHERAVGVSVQLVDARGFFLVIGYPVTLIACVTPLSSFRADPTAMTQQWLNDADVSPEPREVWGCRGCCDGRYLPRAETRLHVCLVKSCSPLQLNAEPHDGNHTCRPHPCSPRRKAQGRCVDSLSGPQLGQHAWPKHMLPAHAGRLGHPTESTNSKSVRAMLNCSAGHHGYGYSRA
jgi:hypothetical protein